MTKSWKPYALHILDCVEKIQLIHKRGDITQDIVLYDAALRNLQTMSEASRHLPENKTSEYATIPWKQISGFRNVLVHDYLGDIDAKTVIKVIETYLPPLEEAVKKMLGEEDI